MTLATVGFVLAASFLAAAVGVGAFLLVAAPVAEVTAAVLRWREPRRDKRSA
jgi:hypothetical protein